MAADFLFDTSPIVAHLRKKFDISAAAPEGALLFTSLLTLGELEKGIARADDPARERAKVDSFMQHIAILTPDGATAKTWGSIRPRDNATRQRSRDLLPCTMATILKAIEATLDPDGTIQTDQPLLIDQPTRVIVTVMVENDDVDLARASETSWAKDWDNPEEDEAWASLQEAP
jgi:predicted nucleic acid-binding protein